ncbi:peroxidase 1 [Brachypodium distachyon]|uniref:Peroxidase n=1 Tax=Brachypodium distachyon TaxID=15368 RepID=A0A0Q3LE38_BRADI|nr:peroxidase 1 [Brachypodium distachyon]KQK21233.1 hypothetical protein BRADI_1g59550v3 [Brachypodium distachyon]|eukprot:XP_003561523.1 peroxidase 1 [Brachypodium distachyon]
MATSRSSSLSGGMSTPALLQQSTAAALFLLLLLAPPTLTTAQLDINFYSKSCPELEKTVRQEMLAILKESPTLAGPFLRLHFHDCFVRGCDASVLLDSGPNTPIPAATAEKDAPPNKSLRGFGAVQRVKDKLDALCPSTVSCADVLALMARDAVFLSSGPSYAVPLGRRDGLRSVANDTKQLPPPTSNFTRLAAMFAAKGLSPKDIVVLSGAHTLGTARCVSFSDRLYNYTGANNLADVDPELDGEYVTALRSRCQSLADNTTLAEMDAGSFETFDAGYYRLVAKRRGVLHSDAALLEDEETRAYVERQATGMFVAEFFRDFAESMVKMGSIGVLTGDQGEIRNKCYVVNSHH